MDPSSHAPRAGIIILSIVCHNTIMHGHVSTRVLCYDDPQSVGVPPLGGAVIGPALLKSNYVIKQVKMIGIKITEY